MNFLPSAAAFEDRLSFNGLKLLPSDDLAKTSVGYFYRGDIKMEVQFICPICLNGKFDDESKTVECSFCGSKMASSGISSDRSYNTVKPFIDDLRSKPEFNEKLYNARIALNQTPEEQEKRKQQFKKMREEREALEREARYGKQADGEVRCPYCNSTQVQLIRRKWSLLTGFATNKVDRICVNCKRKF